MQDDDYNRLMLKTSILNSRVHSQRHARTFQRHFIREGSMIKEKDEIDDMLLTENPLPHWEFKHTILMISLYGSSAVISVFLMYLLISYVASVFS